MAIVLLDPELVAPVLWKPKLLKVNLLFLNSDFLYLLGKKTNCLGPRKKALADQCSYLSPCFCFKYPLPVSVYRNDFLKSIGVSTAYRIALFGGEVYTVSKTSTLTARSLIDLNLFKKHHKMPRRSFSVKFS